MRMNFLSEHTLSIKLKMFQVKLSDYISSMLKVRDLFLRHNEQIHITCFNTVLMGLCNTMWQEGHRGHGNDMLLLVVSEDTGTGGDQIHLRKKALTQFNFLTWVQSNLYSELHDVHSWLKSIMQFDFVQPRVSTTA